MRSTLRLGAGPCLAALLTFALTSPASAATDEERAGARALASAGLEDCNAQRWKECAEKFERAESIIHSPVHLLYIGRSRLELHQLVEAREAFLKITREGAPANASETIQHTVAEAQQRLEALEPRVPTVNVQVQGGDKDVQLFMDGREISSALIGVARPVNPGTHEFQAKAPGMTSTPLKLTLAEGEHKGATLQLVVDPNAPKATPAATASETTDSGAAGGFQVNGLTIAGIAAATVGVGGAVVGTIFLLDSQSKADEVSELCGGDPSRCEVNAGSNTAERIESLNDQAGDSQTLGIVGLGVGAAGLIAGGVLIYLGQTQSDEPPAKSGELRVKPYFGFQSVGLTGTF